MLKNLSYFSMAVLFVMGLYGTVCAVAYSASLPKGSLRTLTNNRWAIVCSRSKNAIYKKQQEAINHVINRSNCKEVFGGNSRLDSMLILLHSTLISKNDCKKIILNSRRRKLRLLIIFRNNRKTNEYIVDQSGLVLSSGNCGYLDKLQNAKLKEFIKILNRTRYDTKSIKWKSALVCYSGFSNESYISTTKQVLLMGHGCREMIMNRNQVGSDLNILIQMLSKDGKFSCDQVNLNLDNLRLFVGVNHGPWYWADSTGAFIQGAHCGRLSTEHKKHIEELLK